MARETKWCQNPKCPEKKNSNQIRGSKGSKYYQSNKASEYYYGLFCSQMCTNQFLNAQEIKIGHRRDGRPSQAHRLVHSNQR